jgi:UTP-glucose-1-phosphate uridylyltransferase
MAAGLGSRFGGLKQLASFGPHGQRIIDYSIYDAIRAGFQRILFIIRKETLDEFSQRIIRPWSSHIVCETVFQSIEDIPPTYAHLASNRTKPWGTAHAIHAARNHIHTPFAIINADDFYGANTFRLLTQHLTSLPESPTTGILIPFTLQNTLSTHGTVSRGLCTLHPDHTLAHIEEHTHIHATPENIITGLDSKKQLQILSPQSPVSMNVWGFTPSLFPLIENSWHRFLANLESQPDTTPEFGLPDVIATHIAQKNLIIHTHTSPAQWFGVTHPQDRPHVEAALNSLTNQGIYPASLHQSVSR